MPESLPHDTRSAVAAARGWGWTAARAESTLLDVLYERHRVVTYPLTTCRHLSELSLASLPDVLRGLAAIGGACDPYDGRRGLPRPSIGPGGVYDDGPFDRGEAYLAIVPVVPCGGTILAAHKAMDVDERKMFRLVVDGFLDALSA